jgi:hypothetical protein
MPQQFPVKKVLANTSLGEFEAADFVGIDDGGTGAVTAADARTALAVQGTAEKAVANGYASLDVSGKVPVAQIPATALPEVHVVADEAERLALVVQEGDEAIQLDDGSHWIYDGATWYERPSGGGSDLETQEEGVQVMGVTTLMNFISKLVNVTTPGAGQVDVTFKATPLIIGKVGNSKEVAYKVMGAFIWPGSDAVGLAASISINVYVQDNTKSIGTVRVWDATNALQIAAPLTNITNEDTTNIESLAALTNISTGEALWEFQGLVDVSDKQVKIDDATVYFT